MGTKLPTIEFTKGETTVVDVDKYKSGDKFIPNLAALSHVAKTAYHKTVGLLKTAGDKYEDTVIRGNGFAAHMAVHMYSLYLMGILPAMKKATKTAGYNESRVGKWCAFVVMSVMGIDWSGDNMSDAKRQGYRRAGAMCLLFIACPQLLCNHKGEVFGTKAYKATEKTLRAAHAKTKGKEGISPTQVSCIRDNQILLRNAGLEEKTRRGVMDAGGFPAYLVLEMANKVNNPKSEDKRTSIAKAASDLDDKIQASEGCPAGDFKVLRNLMVRIQGYIQPLVDKETEKAKRTNRSIPATRIDDERREKQAALKAARLEAIALAANNQAATG